MHAWQLFCGLSKKGQIEIWSWWMSLPGAEAAIASLRLESDGSDLPWFLRPAA